MKSKMKKFTSLFLSLVMILSLCFSVTANATEAAVKYEYTEAVDMDNNELMEGYFNRGVRNRTRPVYRTRLFAFKRNIFPAGYEKEERVYNYILPVIENIAAGKEDNATIEIPIWVILGGKKGQTKYNKKDLGIKSDNDILESIKFDYEMVWHALLRNVPYELYWHDKTKGIEFGDSKSIRHSEDDVIYPESIEFKLMVAADYAPNNAVAGTKVDNKKTKAVNTAVDEAARVVNTAKSKSDYEKLDYFREYICDEVKYNEDAIEPSYNQNFINPWQLIWVFDKDPDTNVVCEGYSKAFKYLCDNSVFSNGNIRCELAEGGTPRSINGDIKEAGHMWNIVRMDDGKSYFVDVTNCDDDYNPNRAYFLVGTKKGQNDFYCFEKQWKYGDLTYTKNVNYKYFPEFEEYYKKLNNSAFLNISDKDYVPKKDVKNYVVDFDLNGIGTGKPEKQIVVDSGKVEIPKDPEAENHIFDGWFKNKETTEKYDFDKEVTEDLTLYAKWKEKIKYTLNILKGKVTSSIDVEDVKPGETVTIKANDPEKGYEFDRWVVKAGDVVLKDENAIETTFKMPESNVKIEAIYKEKKVEIKEYKVTVIDGEASKNLCVAGETVTLKAENKKDKEFSKWVVTEGNVIFKDAEKEVTTFKMPENNVSIKAIYKDIEVPEEPIIPEKPVTPTTPTTPKTGITSVVEKLLTNAAKGLEKIVNKAVSFIERVFDLLSNIFKK